MSCLYSKCDGVIVCVIISRRGKRQPGTPFFSKGGEQRGLLVKECIGITGIYRLDVCRCLVLQH